MFATMCAYDTQKWNDYSMEHIANVRGGSNEMEYH